MRIPQFIASVLVARQAVQLLPSTFCSPECPSCKADVGNFDGTTTSCVANSSFIQNCGLCQSCVMTYAIENGGIETQATLELALVGLLNLCENTSVSTEIAALQSQASRMSALGEQLATTTDPALGSLTSSITMITAAPTAALTDMPSWATEEGTNTAWESLLSTAPWASYYYAHKSAQSAAFAKSTATAESTPKSTASSTSAPPISASWVAGPVMGSVLGISTVFIVLFFTHKKFKQNKVEEQLPAKEFQDNDSNHSSALQKPQLHSDCVAALELENIQVHEMPALEPVASELNTPMEARTRDEDWPISPLPLSPLPLLFAMSEMRDERAGNASPRHETFYHP